MRVIIDSGHNEFTAGKRSFDGSFFEYEFNYDVATRIKEDLERHGITAEVLTTKEMTSSADVNARVKYINSQTDVDLVVSIHANAYGTNWNVANGWEIFSYGLSGEGYKLAQAIKNESIPFLGLKDRGIKDGSEFALVGKTNPVAVLIEHGFYTNVNELALLKSEEFRAKCALADVKGILNYLGIEWIEPVRTIYKVQVGAFASKVNATRIVEKLKKLGFASIIIEVKE